MRRLVLAIVVAAVVALLSGCAMLPGSGGLTAEERANLGSAAQVYQMKGQFLTYLSLANDYAAQPPCSESVVVGCHDPEMVEELQRLAPDINTALDAAEAAVKAGGEPSESDIRAARAGLATLSGLILEEVQ